MKSNQEKYISFLMESIVSNMIIDYLEDKEKPVEFKKIVNHLMKYCDVVGQRLSKMSKVDARDYIMQCLQEKTIKQNEDNLFELPEPDPFVMEMIERFEEMQENGELDLEDFDIYGDTYPFSDDDEDEDDENDENDYK